MPQRNSTWIVVADIDRARILHLERSGSPVRRVFEEDSAPLRQFAVADVVNEMAGAGAIERLILVAAPHVLQPLREALSERARSKVGAECEQDLSRFSDEMVLRVLGETYPDAAEELGASTEASRQDAVVGEAGG